MTTPDGSSPTTGAPAGLRFEVDLPSIRSDLERVELGLVDAVQTERPTFNEVTTHLIRAGGKRLRPVLVVSAGHAVAGGGGANDRVLTGAICVELMHLGSLYHDDVIDVASTRRGVWSANAIWGNVAAILAGDLLLARATALGARLGQDAGELLGNTLATMCTGQMSELEHIFDPDRSEAAYLDAIHGKTASLTATCCRLGALLGEGNPEQIDGLTTFGWNLGMAYQLVDDVLDLVGDATRLGKPVGTDLKEGIYTLPVIRALVGSPELRQLLEGRAEARDRRPPHGNGAAGPAPRLSDDGDDAERCRRALAIITASGAGEETLAMSESYVDAALSALDQTPDLDADVVSELAQLAQSTLARSS